MAMEWFLPLSFKTLLHMPHMKPQNYKSNTILIQWIESFNTATYTGCYVFNWQDRDIIYKLGGQLCRLSSAGRLSIHIISPSIYAHTCCTLVRPEEHVSALQDMQTLILHIPCPLHDRWW